MRADGSADPARAVLFVGQAQVMTPMGAVPISFELEASTLDAAIAKFGDAAEQAVQQTVLADSSGGGRGPGREPAAEHRTGAQHGDGLRIQPLDPVGNQLTLASLGARRLFTSNRL